MSDKCPMCDAEPGQPHAVDCPEPVGHVDCPVGGDEADWDDTDWDDEDEDEDEEDWDDDEDEEGE